MQCKHCGQVHHALGPCPPSHMRSKWCDLCVSTHGEGEVCRSVRKPAANVVASKHPDGNPKSVQGAKKYSLRLLPLPAEVEVNRALEDGLKKYGAANWRETGVAASVYVDACRRHMQQWFDGSQERASDSDVHNLGHAMACLAIIIDAQWNNKLIDDRPTPCRDTDELLKRLEK